MMEKSRTIQLISLLKTTLKVLLLTVLTVDNSGDAHVVGQTQWNRNEFIFPFTGGSNVDTTAHYTLTSTSTNNSITYADDVAKINGYATGQSTWTQSNLQITSAQLGARLIVIGLLR